MTPARLMLNREIPTKLPMVSENTGAIIPEERYKLYQEQLRVYDEPHDLVVGNIVFVANMNKGKLSPNFIGDKYVILNVILKYKGIDTFELVHV